MSSLDWLALSLLYAVAIGKETDIYHVITGESDVPYKQSLDPVYYVGIYDKKPQIIPKTYDIEIMTADSGKRFTCMIPKDEQTVNTKTEDNAAVAGSVSSDATNADTSSSSSEPAEPQEAQTEAILTEDEEEEQEEEVDDEPEKTVEELLQEMDVLENRNRYLQELIVHQQNAPTVRSAKKGNHQKIRKQHSPCYYSREGYWNYEVCLYQKIEQFHGSKNKRNPKIKLGSFVSYIDISRILMNDEMYQYLYLKDIYGLELFENTDKSFIHLLYTGGEGKRESLVTIQCSKAYGERTKDGIIKIVEPKVHHYHFTFIYKEVCEYTNWLKREYNIYDENEEIPPSSQSQAGHHAASPHTFIDNSVYDATSSSASSASTSVSQQLSAMNIDPNSDDVSLLLSPLLGLVEENRCLLLKQGWWTVEFCYGAFIRQIHLEAKKVKAKNGQIVQSLTEWDIKQEHVIGRWPKERVIDRDSFVIHKNANDPARTYASIVYDGGDECDLTKQPRKTEIQFRCGLNLEHSELLKSREDPSCHYIAQVETPLLCGHPDFKIPTAPSYEIVCYPFEDKEFVEAASSMKQVADAQAEYDPILRIVSNAAAQKYGNLEQHANAAEAEQRGRESNADSNVNAQKKEL